MRCSPAKLEANRKNAAKSCGSKTDEGKEASRRNALKHGLAGAGVAPIAEDEAEVTRRTEAFTAELKPTGEIAHALVRRAALHSVRMDRGAKHESAMIAEAIGLVMAEFDENYATDPDHPEVDAVERARAAHRALFDPSPEAVLARRYEAAAERGFFRALRELKVLEKAEAAPIVAKVETPTPVEPEALASFDPFAEPVPAALASFREPIDFGPGWGSDPWRPIDRIDLMVGRPAPVEAKRRKLA